MKILHVNDHYARVGGAESVLLQSMEMLERRGIENVVVYQHGHPNVDLEGRKAYQIERLGDIHESNEAMLGVYRDIIEKENPDLIHIYDIGNPGIVKLSSRLKPAVQTAFNHSFYCPGGQKYLPWLNRECFVAAGPHCFAAAFLTHCNSVRPNILSETSLRVKSMLEPANRFLFLVLSEYQAKWFVRNGIPAGRIKILAPFVPLPEEESTAGSADHNTILFTGRIVPQKGLDLLLKALVYVRAPYRLIVDGDGTDLEKLKRLAVSLRLNNRVEFVGWAERKKHLAYYRKSSFLVLPSIWPEPFGLAGLEAMSYGKPVIAFRVGGIPEWLEDGKTGFLIEPNRVKSMAEKIEFFLNNPEKAKTMGVEGRRMVSVKFGESEYARKLLAIYEESIREWKK